jgi:ABC-2 type transport system permease protein
MACTITRERESGTLSQLMVTSLRRREIVIGKVLPYLAVSMLLILITMAVAYFHFGVKFRQPLVLGLICFLFLLCSLGLGLLISAFCNTQTQAIQFAVFFLLPVFPLSGAFAPLEQLPENIRFISQTFPLTHFCRAFRMINLRNAELSYITGDLVFLFLGAIITCGGAAMLLKSFHRPFPDAKRSLPRHRRASSQALGARGLWSARNFLIPQFGRKPSHITAKTIATTR